jgi:hypothetical protein
MAKKRMMTIAMRAGFFCNEVLADFLHCPPYTVRALFRCEPPETYHDAEELAASLNLSQKRFFELLRSGKHQLKRSRYE